MYKENIKMRVDTIGFLHLRGGKRFSCKYHLERLAFILPIVFSTNG